MHFSSIVQTHVNLSTAHHACERQSLLTPLSSKRIHSLPTSVQRYLDGGEADLSAANWALENNEIKLFKQILSEGFCFSPSQ